MTCDLDTQFSLFRSLKLQRTCLNYLHKVIGKLNLLKCVKVYSFFIVWFRYNLRSTLLILKCHLCQKCSYHLILDLFYVYLILKFNSVQLDNNY